MTSLLPTSPPLAWLALAAAAACTTSSPPSSDPRAPVAAAFAHWARGTGSFYDLLADDATVTIGGTGPHTGTFTKAAFLRDVATPFMARFKTPVVPTVLGVWADRSEVIVRFTSAATDCDDRPYANSYAFFLTMRGDRAAAVTELLDLRAFEDVWSRCVGPTPGAPAAPAPAPTPVGVKLWRLDCGTFDAPADHFSDLLAVTGRRDYVVSCYLIKHGADLMVWDAGLSRALQATPPANAPVRMHLVRPLVDQLAELGFQPQQVTILGISHNHSDHTGQAADLPGARLLMDAADFAALSRRPAPFFTEPAQLAGWISGGRPRDLVNGDRDVFGDGTVLMVALPGHTAGNHGLLVRLDHRGPVLISGDALHDPHQLEHHDLPPSNPSRADSLASLDRIEGIVRDTKATLIVEHDRDSVALLPAFPAYAE